MSALWFILLAVVLIVGNALILLRTARSGKLPKNIKAKPYEDDDEAGW